VLVALLLAMGLLSGCVLVCSGRIESRDYDLEGFEGLNASHGFRVQVSQGDEYAVRVTSDDNILDRVVVRLDGDVLILALPSGTMTTSRLEAEVTMPAIREVVASGGSRVNLSGFSEEQDAFRGDVSGGGRIEGEIHAEAIDLSASGGGRLEGDVFAETIAVSLSGGSQAELDGSGGRLTLSISGGGTGALEELIVESADVNLSGGSQATVNATDSLDATASGGSTLRYIGDPEIGREDASGGSAIRPD